MTIVFLEHYPPKTTDDWERETTPKIVSAGLDFNNDGVFVQFNKAIKTDTVTMNITDNTCSGTLQISADNFVTCLQMIGSPIFSDNDTKITVTVASTMDPSRSNSFAYKVSTAITDNYANSPTSTLSAVIARDYSSENLKVTGNTNALALGNTTSCALLSNATVKCWGFDSYAPISLTPGYIETGYPIQLDAGGNNACLVQNDKTIKCWGSSGFGELGDGNYTDTTRENFSPVTVSDISTATQVTVGYSHACALLENGTIKCWGDNQNGQLGIGHAFGDGSSRVAVDGISNAIQVVAGDMITCALLDDGTIKCWGSNFEGLLGNGSVVGFSATPVFVSGIANATQIAAYYQSICALLSDKTIKCWGTNGNGELGSGGGGEGSIPETVSGISTAEQITVGNGNTCALLSDSTIKCWGQNAFGAVGDGTAPTDQSTPVYVSGISNAVQVKAGDSHICAILSDKSVVCWGSGLGNGDTEQQNTPVSVVDP